MGFEALTFIQTPDFECWVPAMNSLPASKLMEAMIAGHNSDGAKQLLLLMDLLRENLAPDLVDAFNELNVEQTVAVISEWVSAGGGSVE